VHYAFEGYFDKQEEHSALIRLQTYHIVTSNGAKLKSGGDIKVTDLWRLNSDIEEDKLVPSFAASSLELRNQILEQQRKQNAAT